MSSEQMHSTICKCSTNVQWANAQYHMQMFNTCPLSKCTVTYANVQQMSSEQMHSTIIYANVQQMSSELMHSTIWNVQEMSSEQMHSTICKCSTNVQWANVQYHMQMFNKCPVSKCTVPYANVQQMSSEQMHSTIRMFNKCPVSKCTVAYANVQ